MPADDGTYENTNTEVSYLRIRDEIISAAAFLKAEIVVLGEMVEEERQLRPGRKRWNWIKNYRERLARELGHTNFGESVLEEHLNERR